MKMLLLPIGVGVLTLAVCDRSSGQAFFNPGAKFSYTFGERGGYTFGLEMSFTFASRRLEGYTGIALSQDFCFSAKRTKTHIGIEYIPPLLLVGLQVGPTLVKDTQTASLGYTMTVFGGAFLLPYVALTAPFENAVLFEAGSFLKVHFPLEKISLVH
jgi:hypothetical protein